MYEVDLLNEMTVPPTVQTLLRKAVLTAGTKGPQKIDKKIPPKPGIAVPPKHVPKDPPKTVLVDPSRKPGEKIPAVLKVMHDDLNICTTVVSATQCAAAEAWCISHSTPRFWSTTNARSRLSVFAKDPGDTYSAPVVSPTDMPHVRLALPHPVSNLCLLNLSQAPYACIPHRIRNTTFRSTTCACASAQVQVRELLGHVHLQCMPVVRMLLPKWVGCGQLGG